MELLGFTIDRHKDAPVCVARLAGDVDLAVVPDVRCALESAIAAGCTNVVLDMSHVHYADSSALGLLVWLDRRVEPYGGRVVIANADRNVTRVLELSGLVGVAPSIHTASSVDEAIAGLDTPPVSTEPLWSQAFTVPPDIEEMGHVRARVCSLVETLGLPENAVFDIRVAVGEALANAVRHGSTSDHDAPIEVRVSAFADRVVVTIRDRGEGFDGQPDAAEDVYASGGRGVLFMRALMDRVDFDRADDGVGTVVSLTKRLPMTTPSGAVRPPRSA